MSHKAIGEENTEEEEEEEISQKPNLSLQLHPLSSPTYLVSRSQLECWLYLHASVDRRRSRSDALLYSRPAEVRQLRTQKSVEAACIGHFMTTLVFNSASERPLLLSRYRSGCRGQRRRRRRRRRRTSREAQGWNVSTSQSTSHDSPTTQRIHVGLLSLSLSLSPFQLSRSEKIT